MITQREIIEQVRSWLGTRFHHQGRIKKSAFDKGGVDCIGLIIGVAGELGIKLPDQTGYSRLPEGKLLLELSQKYLQLKPLSEINISDIVLLRIEQEPQHFAIIGDGVQGLTLIHSYAPLKQVVEHHLDKFWYERIIGVFEFPTI